MWISSIRTLLQIAINAIVWSAQLCSIIISSFSTKSSHLTTIHNSYMVSSSDDPSHNVNSITSNTNSLLVIHFICVPLNQDIDKISNYYIQYNLSSIDGSFIQAIRGSNGKRPFINDAWGQELRHQCKTTKTTLRYESIDHACSCKLWGVIGFCHRSDGHKYWALLFCFIFL